MQPTTTAPEPSIAQSWVKALNECQIDALVALYHGEALFWATTARALATKPEDVRRYYDAACKSMKASNFKLEVASESVKLYGDAAVSAGQTTATFTNRQGQPQTASFRFSLSARKVEGQWLIVEQHVSAMPASPGQ
jgi:ketosteroid isomerase-like protein